MRRTFRTLLEQKIWERRQTFEEFAAYAETYAREHDEPGTLGVRHLQRLVAGRRSDGRPLGPVRAETARLLEHIFRLSIDQLLGPPMSASLSAGHGSGSGGAHVLRVAIAVVVRGSETLIVCRRGMDGAGISWQFPAGIVKPAMIPGAIAVQETFAETGVHCGVIRELGSRVHPITNVVCDYVLCEYLTGEAQNVDVVENIGVTWVEKAELTRFIPAGRIYRPVLDVLELVAEPV